MTPTPPKKISVFTGTPSRHSSSQAGAKMPTRCQIVLIFHIAKTFAEPIPTKKMTNTGTTLLPISKTIDWLIYGGAKHLPLQQSPNQS